MSNIVEVEVNNNQTVEETPRPVIKARNKSVRVSFFVGKEHLKAFAFEPEDRRQNPTIIYHAYPKLTDWVGRSVPDQVNPRSHGEDCLKSQVAKSIKETLIDRPEDFYLANRGSTIIVQSLNFDPETGVVELVINDPDNQGLADGATTDAVIAQVQNELLQGKSIQDVPEDEWPEQLKKARLHLEIVVGLKDRSRIGEMVSGRNTSRQVRSWSMADFKGDFDCIKHYLESEDSEFKGRIGYEENSGKDASILDVMSVLTLFHPSFDCREDGKPKAPTVAYSSKGRMDAILTREDMIEGYRSLFPLVPEILGLHDYVYVNFPNHYNAAFGPRAKLGRRYGVDSRKLTDPYVMPFTGASSNYVIPNGLIFPLLNAFRALLKFEKKDDKLEASWASDPFKLYDKHGRELIHTLIDQLEFLGGNPNTAGKKKPVYIALHQTARLMLNDELKK